MADIKNDDKFFCVINGIYNSIVSNAYSMVVGIKKLFTSKRSRVFFQRNDFVRYFILKRIGISGENLFSASGNFNVVNIYRPRFVLISNASFLKERVFSCLRRSASAKSIISSCICLFLSNFDKKDSCSVWGKFIKAVRNTSAIASAGVINIHHPSIISLSAETIGCQGGLAPSRRCIL